MSIFYDDLISVIFLIVNIIFSVFLIHIMGETMGQKMLPPCLVSIYLPLMGHLCSQLSNQRPGQKKYILIFFICFVCLFIHSFLFQIKRIHLLLTVKESAMDVPTNLEARRRISFFTNSLFMDMPDAPEVRKMVSFS